MQKYTLTLKQIKVYESCEKSQEAYVLDLAANRAIHIYEKQTLTLGST
jgi:hypothetical protein